MSPLTDPSQCVVITALVARRRHLQEQIMYWSEVASRQREVIGAASAHAEAVRHLKETEAAMLELDKRVVPWLHCHPDCADLFAGKPTTTHAMEAA